MMAPTNLFMDRDVFYIADIASFTAVNILPSRCCCLFNLVQCIWLCTHIAKLILFCQTYPGVMLKEKHTDHFCIKKSSGRIWHIPYDPKKEGQDLQHDVQVICSVQTVTYLPFNIL